MESLQVKTVRFLPGQELKEGLLEFVKSHGFRAGFVMTCVGSVRSAKLRFATPLAGSGSPVSTSSEKVVNFDKENFEICSLVGTLSPEGLHLHTVLSRADGTTVGGHVVGNMVVQTTVELVIGESLKEIYYRKDDPNTGYKELVAIDRTTTTASKNLGE